MIEELETRGVASTGVVTDPPCAPLVPEWADPVWQNHWDRDLGTAPIPTDRYWSRAFHEMEIDRVWSRVWQLACWENDIPNTGDTIAYDIGPLSFAIVRTASGSVKAFYNSCLHRGTRLVNEPSCVRSLRCPYHAWTWDLDGALKYLPADWDFPHIDRAKMQLPQAKVATWGGMVFLNPDPNAISLEEYLSPLPEQCQRYWPLERRARIAHVAKVFRANWKLTYANFIETYHVPIVHPQLGVRTHTGNGRTAPIRSTFKFDWWDRISRNAALDSGGMGSDEPADSSSAPEPPSPAAAAMQSSVPAEYAGAAGRAGKESLGTARRVSRPAHPGGKPGSRLHLPRLSEPSARSNRI